MISAEQLSYTYQDQRAINFNDFRLDSSHHLLISGPSGCGKSTLMHLLAGLIQPHTGSLTVYGTALEKLNQKAADAFRRETVGIVFQEYFLIKALSVWENLLLAQNAADKHHLSSLLEQLGIRDLAHKKPGQISQGQAQRVAIARALVNKPKLILADEPTAHLDDKNAEMVIKLLISQADSLGASLVTITHDQRINGFFDNKMQML